MHMSEFVNQSELARRLGITEGAIRKGVKSGLYKRGHDGLINFEVAKASWEMNRDPDGADDRRDVEGAAGTPGSGP
jgi:hypothetical protein